MVATLGAMKNTIGDGAFQQVMQNGVANAALMEAIGDHFTKLGSTGQTTIVQGGIKEVQRSLYSSVDKATQAILAGTSPNVEADSAAVEQNTKAIINDLSRIRPGDQVKLTETINCHAKELAWQSMNILNG